MVGIAKPQEAAAPANAPANEGEDEKAKDGTESVTPGKAKAVEAEVEDKTKTTSTVDGSEMKEEKNDKKVGEAKDEKASPSVKVVKQELGGPAGVSSSSPDSALSKTRLQGGSPGQQTTSVLQWLARQGAISVQNVQARVAGNMCVLLFPLNHWPHIDLTNLSCRLPKQKVLGRQLPMLGCSWLLVSKSVLQSLTRNGAHAYK